METLISILTLVTLIVSVALLWSQLEKLRKANRLIAAGERFQARDAAFPLVTSVEGLRGRVENFFDRDVYEKYYRDNDERTLAYLALHQQYAYLAFFLAVGSDDPVHVRGSLWLDRLVLQQEFLHVHEREGSIYPAVNEEVKCAIVRAANSTIRWAADGKPVDS